MSDTCSLLHLLFSHAGGREYQVDDGNEDCNISVSVLDRKSTFIWCSDAMNRFGNQPLYPLDHVENERSV